ncbi:WAT1-related protein At4g08300 [Linum perenne]
MGEKGNSWSELAKKAKPYLAMVSLQFGYAGMYIVTMLSFKHGMNHFVLGVYRHVVATIVIAPFALILERKTRPKLTLGIFLRIIMLGFLEPVLDQNLYYVGMKYTSATFASVSVNILPAITFVMALIFRLESVNLKKLHSVAKIIGTVITVSGAMVMTLYKGPILEFLTPSSSTAAHSMSASDVSNGEQHWILGPLLLLGIIHIEVVPSGAVLDSVDMPDGHDRRVCRGTGGREGHVYLEDRVRRQTSCSCLHRTYSILSFCSLDYDALSSNLETNNHRSLQGIVCSGAAYYIQGVVIKERGPVFVTSFSPLCMIITAILGSLVLAEKVSLGSVIGAVLIVCGLYTVVWGKSKDQKISAETEELDWKNGGEGHELPVANVVPTNSSTR